MAVWDVLGFCFFVSSGVAGHCRFTTAIQGLPTEGKGLKRSAVGILCWL